jgi:hypothetical protein
LTLRGIGRDRSVVSTDVPDRVLDVLTGAGVTIEALTIAGGAAPDGANGATGEDGQPGEPGGGIRNDGKLELIDSAVRGNRAGRGGLGAAATVNIGSAGGGIYSLDTPNNNLPQGTTTRCVVPRLKGKTLVAAARALGRANCQLGSVTRRGRGRQGRVRTFSPKAGDLAPGRRDRAAGAQSTSTTMKSL